MSSERRLYAERRGVRKKNKNTIEWMIQKSVL